MDTLLQSLGVTCMRVPASSKRSFVISDHPVSHYDPTPKTPEAGASFLSSPGSVTWVPLDPKFGVLLGQRNPGSWVDVELSDPEIDELNLQTYAWAREAIYGPSQAAVTRVREIARAKPALLHELRYRPPRVWVGARSVAPQLTASAAPTTQRSTRLSASSWRPPPSTSPSLPRPAASAPGHLAKANYFAADETSTAISFTPSPPPQTAARIPGG